MIKAQPRPFRRAFANRDVMIRAVRIVIVQLVRWRALEDAGGAGRPVPQEKVKSRTNLTVRRKYFGWLNESV